MSKSDQHFYIPSNRPLSIISQYIPPDDWTIEPRFKVYLTTCDSTLELNFSTINEVQRVLSSLEKLQTESDKSTNSIQTYVDSK